MKPGQEYFRISMDNATQSMGFWIEKIKILFIFFISACYAFILSTTNHDLFRDLHNYISYINAIDVQEQLMLNNGVIFFEPLFLYIFKGLNLFLTSYDVVTFVIFFNCFSFSFYILTRFNVAWSLLLFFLVFFQPQTFALQLVTIRQGLGVSLILWLFPLLTNQVRLGIFLSILGLIHNSFFIIALFVFADYGTKKFLFISDRSYRLVALIIFGLVINAGVFLLMQFVKAKQSSYEDQESAVGGGAFLVWLLVFFYVLVFKPNNYENKYISSIYQFVIIGLTIYLTSYFLNPIAGRIIGTFLPFVYFIILYKATFTDIVLAILLLILNFLLFFRGGAEAFMQSDLRELTDEVLNIILQKV